MSYTYPDYGNDTLLSLESWSSPDVAVEIFLQHFGLMALLCPWWNLESLAWSLGVDAIGDDDDLSHVYLPNFKQL